MKPEVITNKWSKTGLLDGIKSTNDRNLLASNLEKAVLKLIKVASKGNPQENEQKAATFLPIIRRLFDAKKVRVIKNIHPLYQKFEKFFKNNYKTMMDLEYIHAIDGEAEFCAMFVDFYEKL